MPCFCAGCEASARQAQMWRVGILCRPLPRLRGRHGHYHLQTLSDTHPNTKKCGESQLKLSVCLSVRLYTCPLPRTLQHSSNHAAAALQRLAILAALQRLARLRSAPVCSVWLFALLCSVYGTGVLAALQRWTSVVNCVMSFPGLTVLGIRLPACWTQAKIDRAHAKVGPREQWGALECWG